MDLVDVKGIGEKKKNLLNKLGIFNTYDLLCHFPFRFEVYKRSKELVEDKRIVIDGYIVGDIKLIYFKKMNKMSFYFNSSIGNFEVVIFNRAFLKKNLRSGVKLTLVGKYNASYNQLVVSEIKFGLLDKLTIVPIYHLKEGISNKEIHKYINMALVIDEESRRSKIPLYLEEKYKFITRHDAFKEIHNPTEGKKIQSASLRLKYEELFIFMTKIMYLKKKKASIKGGIEREDKEKELNAFISSLPFEITNDQKKAIEEVINDLKSPNKMNRMLQGDVGSGKTIVSFIAIYYNFLNGYQSALMAPTEILALQHYNSFKELFKKINISVELLTGSFSKKEKERIYEEVKKGKVDVLIGTHTLFQDNLEYFNLGLVITDEQHRFGVNQRKNLSQKGKNADILYMSATPIPRTFALTIYGDMDISSIREMPKGRKIVKTMIYKTKDIKEVISKMEEELENGHQIYVVAPLIEESENSDLTDTLRLYKKIKEVFKSYNVGLIHGREDSNSKDLVMAEFKSGKINILVSTTVIEVGVDVENATMMVIFDAYQFGLSTLHQLRGRVGRSNLPSYCFLISDLERDRLDIMTKTNDGFLISEEDFKLRGAGEIFGTRQSGDMTFKIADLKKDYRILLQARKDAEEFLKRKDYLELKEFILQKLND